MNNIARFAAENILNSLPVSMAIALLAWGLARVLRSRGSRTRFVIWLSALFAIVVLPWFGSVGADSLRAVQAQSTGAVTLPGSLAKYLVVAWALGAALGFSHVVLGLHRLRGLRATCVPVHLGELDPALRATLDEVRQHRRVTLCTSDAVRVPSALGYFRPAVVLPKWALVEVPPQELSAILLHELAHLRRYDDWTNLAQKLVKAIFFFHPAVWFIESRLTLAREMACDDAVLAANFSPRAYAASLVSLAERSFLRRGIDLVQAAVSHAQQLTLRLSEILRKEETGQGSARITKPVVALISLVGIIATYGLSHAPRLVAFSGGAAQVASAGQTVSLAAESALQPVNLSYTGTTAQSTLPARKVSPSSARSIYRALPRPLHSLARHTKPLPPLEEGISSPSVMALATLPMDLAGAPAPVIVVFHSSQFVANGQVYWQVTVLRLTQPQQRAVIGGFGRQI